MKILVPLCPSVWLVDLLANEEIVHALVSHVVSGTPRDYFEFVQTKL